MNKSSEKIKKIKNLNEEIKLKINNTLLDNYKTFLKVYPDSELITKINNYFLFSIIEYISYLGDNSKIKEELIEKLKKSKIIKNFVKEFIEYYQNKSKEIIEPILEKKSLEYLDIQINKEKEF